MDDAGILAKIAELGLELPPPPKAVAAYVPIVVSNGLAFLAGQIPMIEGALLHPGRLGAEVRNILGGRAKRSGIPLLWDGHAAERIATVVVNGQ